MFWGYLMRSFLHSIVTDLRHKCQGNTYYGRFWWRTMGASCNIDKFQDLEKVRTNLWHYIILQNVDICLRQTRNVHCTWLKRVKVWPFQQCILHNRPFRYSTRQPGSRYCLRMLPLIHHPKVQREASYNSKMPESYRFFFEENIQKD